MPNLEVKVTGSEELKLYLERLPAKMQRGAIRPMTNKSSTILRKEIVNQIKRRNMPYSRNRNRAERKKARDAGSKPLVRTITKKYWSRPSRGLVGYVVGPAYHGGQHGHLVERGHRITGHARIKFRGLSLKGLRRGKLRRKNVKLGRRGIARSGDMTVAHRFQETAMEAKKQEMFKVHMLELAAFIRKQGTRKI